MTITIIEEITEKTLSEYNHVWSVVFAAGEGFWPAAPGFIDLSRRHVAGYGPIRGGVRRSWYLCWPVNSFFLIYLYKLRLDNTGAGVIEVNPLLLGNYKTDNVDLYIKWKLRIFSFLWYQIHITVMFYSEIVI